MVYAMALPAIAAVLGAASGACIGWTGAQSIRRARAARARAPDDGRAKGGVQASACLSYLEGLSRRLALRATRSVLPVGALRGAHARFEEQVGKAGLGGTMSAQACCEGAVRLAAAGAAAGALLGCAASNELAVVGCVTGGIAGATAPGRAVRGARRQRAQALERSMSEMLEVVALGVRSGLSFDRSLQLYTGHFDDGLARECAVAQRSWEAGLATRQDALRALAQGYDNPLFSRTVSAIIRSLRFGTSLGEVLEQAAEQARAARKAQVEERVAKAPVKMMIPTGTLILPAMLLLVLGPVLLELMEGM